MIFLGSRPMRNKFSFVTGIVLIILGVLIIIADIFNGYACLCPAQIIGQPNTCVCEPPFGYYFVLIFGIVLEIMGLVLLVMGLLSQRQLPKLASTGSQKSQTIQLTSLQRVPHALRIGVQLMISAELQCLSKCDRAC